MNRHDRFDELSLIIKDNNFHIFAISETWLINNISSENFYISGYNPIMRLDRIGRTGGGVALFSIDSLVLKRRQDLELPGHEFLWAEFIASGRNFLCGVCYRPPDNDNMLLADFFNGFQFMLDRIRMLGGNHKLIILGDFNAHYSQQFPNNSTEIGKQFHNFIILNDLEQLISEPTRVTLSTSTTLDLLITNCSNEFFSTGTLSFPLNCDHPVIFGEMVIALHERHCFKRDVWDFSHVNTVNLNRELLQVDWSDILDSCFDVDLIYEKWYRVFTSDY